MRTPLTDALSEPDSPAGEGDAARRLAVLFESAEGRENAYAAERLRELYEVAERAMTLGAEAEARRLKSVPPPTAPWPLRAASVVAGGLLALTAPVLAETSLILASLSGLAALAAVILPFRGRREAPALPPPDPARRDERISSVAAAADRALQAMVEPRQLPSPARIDQRRADEDVLLLLQDALAQAREAETEEGRELGENARRVLGRMGYTAAFDAPADMFEVMLDPGMTGEVVLRPALLHSSEPGRSVPGVKVRGG